MTGMRYALGFIIGVAATISFLAGAIVIAIKAATPGD